MFSVQHPWTGEVLEAPICFCDTCFRESCKFRSPGISYCPMFLKKEEGKMICPICNKPIFLNQKTRIHRELNFMREDLVEKTVVHENCYFRDSGDEG